MAESLQWVIDMLLPLIESVKQRRLSVEREWLLNYRAWQGWPSQSYTLSLPSNGIYYFIPHARRAIERNVKRGSELALPERDWHENLPFDNESHANAEAVHSVMKYVYEKKLSTKRLVDECLRCLQLYNFAAVHTSVQVQRKEIWPYQEAVDPFSFYIFPDTTIDVNKALVLFEEVIVPYQVYRSFVDTDSEKKSIYKNIQADDLQVPEWPYHLIERLAYRGLTQLSDLTQGSGNIRRYTEEEMDAKLRETREDAKNTLRLQSKAFVALSKVYFRLGSQWFYTVLCTNLKGGGASKNNCEVVRLDETENTPLYRWTSTRSLPGELYTNAPMDDIRVLQNLTNNAISDVEANRTQVQANPIAIDATHAGRFQEKTFGNRKLWLTDGNPNDIIHSVDIEDVSTNGIRAWQIYLGLLDKGSGGTLAEGQPGRNMPRAGFAAQNLLNMALVEIKDDVKTLNVNVLTPGLADVYHVILEYIPQSQLIKIPSKHPELIKAYKKKDLVGDYSFSWLGALDFQDSQERADKFVQFSQLIFNPQILPLLLQELQRKGKTLDIEHMLTTIYSYGLGERGLGDIIIPLSPEEIQALQQPKPDPQMLLQQQKGQQEQEKHQADLAGKQMDIQGKQQELQGNQQLKLLDIKQKQMDTLGKLMSIGSGTNGSSGQEK